MGSDVPAHQSRRTVSYSTQWAFKHLPKKMYLNSRKNSEIFNGSVFLVVYLAYLNKNTGPNKQLLNDLPWVNCLLQD